MTATAAPGPAPLPPWTFHLDVPDDPHSTIDWRAVPATRGLCAFEDESGRTLALAAGADLRRLVRGRLTEPDDDTAPSRRADVRGIARTVRGLTVGSTFESDWVYLGLTAARLPLVHRALLDRYQAWFVHVDPGARFPQLSRSPAPTAGAGAWLGPMADKRAAARYIELLQDAFDLCRYHDLLVQTPNALACAYKEMGRCPAPCDGTVSLESYRRQVDDAVAFASSDGARRCDELRRRMSAASDRLDFETARHCKERLDRLEALRRDRFVIVDRIERFRFLAIQPAEAPGIARIFLVTGGGVEPLADCLGVAGDRERRRGAAEAIIAAATARPGATVRLDDTAVATIGLVCSHLFAPKRRGPSGRFLKIDGRLDATTLVAAIDRLLTD